MPITVIKEGIALRLIDSSEQIAEGTRLVLFTEQELHARDTHNAASGIQIPAFIRCDDGESAEELF
jgi:hypothetical protein